MPMVNIKMLMSGNRIKRIEGTMVFGVPEAPKPKGICCSDGIRIPNQTTKPRLRMSPLIHKNRAMGLSQACAMIKDGYTDFDSAGVRLPISVARAKVRTSAAASRGEMAKTRFEVAM